MDDLAESLRNVRPVTDAQIQKSSWEWGFIWGAGFILLLLAMLRLADETGAYAGRKLEAHIMAVEVEERLHE